ncbi:MAG: hotdog fold thioesterase [Chitinophagaceae bacterium]|nr:hotdog fold thioesterase [Chitinophagaceae bacterium]MEA3424993.1 hotdog fold thioesterase [Bacteroidota bacterium]MCA6452682.1 hotdog fold thioesterase [Chitinophagaceae bacterium]MCA6455780.1 hotdog fold thioesterase [Chitinophagaceae bacterium]MCA6460643.1 hotdog fold thioesterase [Chitinophagaceae bacterium]
MPIWFKKDLRLADFENLGKDTMGDHIGIRFSALGDNYLKATMPVDHRTKQPYGLLHGGASVALAETLGSVGSALVIDPEHFICVGQEINANHIRSARSGQVTGTATPIHLGATSHVWEIRIHDEQDKLVCVSRLTVAILKKR